MNISKRFEGCIVGGAIGDAWGSGFENQFEKEEDTYYLLGKPEVKEPEWGITDDTQFTLLTCEAIMMDEELKPETLAKKFVDYYRNKLLKGLGASTIKALRELDQGGHWSQVGRRGEYAAGNGAAMRIAPVAFCENIDKERIREICSITHNNDDAYVGALSVVMAIKSALNGTWTGKEDLIEIIIDKIPDTRVRDRLIEIQGIEKISDLKKFGTNSFVVNSIPLAIGSANLVKRLGMKKMFEEIIAIGGDTDTNCSIAGQISGALIGNDRIPSELMHRLSNLWEYKWIVSTINKFKTNKNWKE